MKNYPMLTKNARPHQPLLYNCGYCFLFLCFIWSAFASCRKTDKLIPGAAISSVSDSYTSERNKKPNVILILGDDIGYEIATCNGGQSYSTPNIDMMAQRGVRFTQCHGSPLCSPARFTLLTGKYNFRNYTEWGVMKPTEKTLATLFKSVGYSTCVAGKWQLDGGDSSITSLGFEKYSLWNAYKIFTTGGQGFKYKSPTIYQDGNYLPDSITKGKYSEDIFTKYITDFIDSNKSKRFFVYYAPPLCHEPFSPTPDDLEFATWNPKLQISDPRFFPSMVKYMDKKIGEIINKVEELGLLRNTVILFTGDNGTPREIYSVYNDSTLEGGKGSTKELGTHVPFMIFGGGLRAGKINANMIAFPDFMSTFAEITGADISSYDTLDGISFLKQLTGQPYTPRPYIYDYYHPLTDNGNTTLKPWIQDTVYKLYHISDNFYNIITDPNELSPIEKASMTPEQKAVYDNFVAILSKYPNYPTP